MSEQTFVVSVFDTTRCYGGPEEGGWWYGAGYPCDEPECLKHMKVFGTRENARDYSDVLVLICDQLNDEWGNRQPGSVLSTSWLVPHITEGMPKAYPEERPYYE